MADVALELLGTAGCHLCDEAERTVRMAARVRGFEWTCVDIADDEALVTRYAERIPLLRASNGEREVGWPFGPLDVLRLLDG